MTQFQQLMPPSSGKRELGIRRDASIRDDKASTGPSADNPECDDQCDCRRRMDESVNAQTVVVDFTNIVTDDAKAHLERRGLGHHLVPPQLPICVIGVDLPISPCVAVPATNEQIWAIADLVDRAVAIVANDLYGVCPDTRALISSVEEAGVIGLTAQTRLLVRMPYRKPPPPWWYNPYRRWPRDTRPGLFEACGIDVNAPADGDK